MWDGGSVFHLLHATQSRQILSCALTETSLFLLREHLAFVQYEVQRFDMVLSE